MLDEILGTRLPAAFREGHESQSTDSFINAFAQDYKAESGYNTEARRTSMQE